MFLYKLNNLNDTKTLADIISRFLEPNTFLLLKGELGAGKTQLTKFIGKNLGVEQSIKSPTFNILNIYPSYYDHQSISLVHVDLYRVPNLTLEEWMTYYELMSNSVNIIEWPTKFVEEFLQLSSLIEINILIKDNERVFDLKTKNLDHHSDLYQELEKSFTKK